MTKNIIIRASAGTGKTYRLANRIISLLASGAPSEQIVALTFSRLASAEIFNRVMSHLAQAASSPEGAARRNAEIGADLTQSQYLEIIRKIIRTQHLSRIGTIDSFMAQILRVFQDETKLAPGTVMLGEYDAEAAKRNALDAIFTNPEMFEALNYEENAVNSRSVFAQLEKEIAALHLRRLNLPNVGGKNPWTPFEFAFESPTFHYIPPSSRPQFHSLLEEIKEKAMPEIVAAKNKNVERSFNSFLTKVEGKQLTYSYLSPEKDKNKFAQAIIESIADDSPITVESNRKVLNFDQDVSVLMRVLLLTYLSEILDDAIASTGRLCAVADAYEAEYDKQTRSAGKLQFDDIPRFIESIPPEKRLDIDFRLDGMFRHWALDEFQDTSPRQWRVLQNLIDEANQSDGDHSVFIVGDMKQAIYGWRGGDSQIFREECNKAKLGYYEAEELLASRRFGPAIRDFVNEVFSPPKISAFFDFADSAPAAEIWKENWQEHQVVPENQDRQDFVSVAIVPEDAASGAETDAQVSAYCRRLSEELLEVEPWERNISVAILLRENRHGPEIERELKKRLPAHVSVVWEGNISTSDSPATEKVLRSLTAADFPETLFPAEHRCAADNQATRQALTRLGLARYLRGKDGITSETATAAESFISVASASTLVSDFNRYLSTEKVRVSAASANIRILTIHRSKGLGFDWVIIPFFGHTDIKSASWLVSPSADWVLAKSAPKFLGAIKVINDAEALSAKREYFEMLCLYYVAITRAKYALTILLPEPSKIFPSSPQKSFRYQFFNITNLPFSNGNPRWWEGKEKRAKEETKTEKSAASVAPSWRRGKNLAARALPFDGNLFSEKSAAWRGIKAHELLAKIEWEPKLGAPFTKPDDFVALWREKDYTLAGKPPENGRFDRVVICKNRAMIYDFKTGHERDYSEQLTRYRRALSKLTKLPESAIFTEIIPAETLIKQLS